MSGSSLFWTFLVKLVNCVEYLDNIRNVTTAGSSLKIHASDKTLQEVDPRDNFLIIMNHHFDIDWMFGLMVINEILKLKNKSAYNRNNISNTVLTYNGWRRYVIPNIFHSYNAIPKIFHISIVLLIPNSSVLTISNDILENSTIFPVLF